MILHTNSLNSRISVENQKKELDKIKKATSGTVIYRVALKENTDIIETLLFLSRIKYVKFYWMFHVHFKKV